MGRLVGKLVGKLGRLDRVVRVRYGLLRLVGRAEMCSFDGRG